MAYATEKQKQGRQPFHILEIQADKCSLTYGVAPCTATIGSGQKCFNTLGTCQDVPNYSGTTVNVRPCEQVSHVPPELGLIPCLAEPPKIKMGEADPGVSMGVSATLTATFLDFPFHDIGIDPYILENPATSGRTYTWRTITGTFWGRWLARNLYLNNRVVRMWQGFISESGFDFADGNWHHFVIDRIDGPDRQGRVTLRGTDPLSMLGDDKAVCPIPTTGELTAAMTAVETTSFTLTDEDDWTRYPSTNGYVAIGSEIIKYASRAVSGADVSTASYASKSFSVTTQETQPRSLIFSADGTKMYVVGIANGTVYQYTLSTAWDVSTASYASKNFSVASQEVTPTSVTFSTDGTKIYVVGDTNDTVYQYTLSTAWDVSTASYASKSFSVTTQETDPRSVIFSTDGTKMYVVGVANDTVYQYTLSTAWDVSTASYASKNFSVASQEVTPTSVTFSNEADSTKMYVVGVNNDTVYQYTLTPGSDMVFITLTRGQGGSEGTTPEAHEAGDVAQVVWARIDKSPIDLLEELCKTDTVTGHNYAGMPTAWITTADWQGERDEWLPGHQADVYLSEPTPVKDLANRIIREAILQVWWDMIDQKLRLQVMRPPFTLAVPEFTDATDVVEDSVSVKVDATKRISRVAVHYGVRSWTESLKEKTNFITTVMPVDIDAESADQYGDERTRVIYAWFIKSGGVATRLARRTLSRYRNPPEVVTFLLDVKDTIEVGDYFDLTTESIQDIYGAAKQGRLQVIGQRTEGDGIRQKILGISGLFNKRYGLIAPSSTPDYGSATAEQREKYLFISDSTTDAFANGDEEKVIL